MHVSPIALTNALYPLYFALCYLRLRRYRDPITPGTGWLHRYDGTCPFYAFPATGDPRLSPEENQRRRDEIAKDQRRFRWLSRHTTTIRACWVVLETVLFPLAVVHVCMRLQKIMSDFDRCKCHAERL